MFLIISFIGLLLACFILVTLYLLAPVKQSPARGFSMAGYLARHRQYQLANDSKLWIDVEHGGSGAVQRSLGSPDEDMSMAPTLLLDRSTSYIAAKIR
jgi:hypothetical protein